MNQRQIDKLLALRKEVGDIRTIVAHLARELGNTTALDQIHSYSGQVLNDINLRIGRETG